jgi:hypothetical protein
MIASLDLARFPLGIAEREALALRRAGRRSDAAFARLLLPMRLRSMPWPVPRLTIAYTSRSGPTRRRSRASAPARSPAGTTLASASR